MTIFDEVRAYLAKVRVTQAQLGWAIARDRAFITRLINDQLVMTQDRARMIRQWIFDNPDFPAAMLVAEADDRQSPASLGNSDYWMKDAKLASAMLLDRLRLAHPERCCV